MGFLKNFSLQFRHPKGFGGKVAGYIMAHTTGARNAWTLSQLNIEIDDQVLEIGHGPGIGILKCSEMAKQGKITGIDISETMHELAAHRNQSAIKNGNVELRIGGIETFDSFEERFDKIYSVNSVMFWPDRLAAFQNLYAWLKSGGVIATTYQPMYKGATKEDAVNYADDLINILKEVGFTNISKEMKDFKPVAAVCVLARKRTQKDYQ
ncbi:class I SAM-dependent methyltransferase [Thalassobacillus sp. CUG 92003]|uniref:class I SAM-dependent methyltransferase n=1 Tax=Thalassobacillus sp. CUG 92003 TaxID=2736641 RepID=UPI0015E6C062|nr:class I SAM-dependent methyltransferase [Thalassobacillus sp. CUG 92003]